MAKPSLSNQPPRLLAAKAAPPRYRTLPNGRQTADDTVGTGDAELGYTTSPAHALPGEPEAVGADDQERMTLAVRRAQRERRRREWETARSSLRTAADILLAQQLTRTSDVRVLERFIARIDRRIG